VGVESSRRRETRAAPRAELLILNFFEHQANARRRTAVYVLLFVLATTAVVIAANVVVLVITSFFVATSMPVNHYTSWLAAHPHVLVWTTAATLSFVGGASLYRMVSLAGGGGSVARSLGGTLIEPTTQDPRLRQLRNIVEETAIAAGVPVPELYVLERETGINAFAAGFTTSDAAIAVTRGALTHLKRDELQGVIGHEFSHILNGDTRLNTRLVGVLFGILAIGLAGRVILRLASESRDVRAIGFALLPALALLTVGYLGYFFGQLIQAAVSRSRESLADSCAVQFTRNPLGLAGALKKIAVLSGAIRTPQAGQVSHMLIADHADLGSFFATHPPIIERIRAIQPYFDERDLARVSREPVDEQPAHAAVSGAATPATVVGSVGRLTGAGLAAAADRRAGIPATLTEAAHSPVEALNLVVALILNRSAEGRVKQMEVIRKNALFPGDLPARIEALAVQMAQMDPADRLPLFEIAFPALRQRTPQELRALGTLLEQLTRTDGTVDVFEYALVRLCRLQIYEVLAPQARRAPVLAPKLYALRAEVQALFSLLARAGEGGATASRAAYLAGVNKLLPTDAPDYAPTLQWDALDRALLRLDFLAPPMKAALIEALVTTVMHDRQVTLAESELLRAVCASLHCPLPPLITDLAA